MNKSDLLSSKTSIPCLQEGIQALELVFKLYQVGKEAGDTLKTVGHVTHCLENIRRLRRTKAGHLGSRDLAWVDSIIKDTEDAIGSLAKLVERARVNKETKDRINLYNRASWVLKYGPMVNERVAQLTVCHTSLLTVCPLLLKASEEHASGAEERLIEEDKPLQDLKIEKWLEWQDSRQRRSSQMSLRPDLIQRPMSVSSGSTNTTSPSFTGSTRPPYTTATSSTNSLPHRVYDQTCDSSSYLHQPACKLMTDPRTGTDERVFGNPSHSFHRYHESSAQQHCSLPSLAEFPALTLSELDRGPKEDDHSHQSQSPIHKADMDQPTLIPSSSDGNADGLQPCETPDDFCEFKDWVQHFQFSTSSLSSEGGPNSINSEQRNIPNVEITEPAKRGKNPEVPRKMDIHDISSTAGRDGSSSSSPLPPCHHCSCQKQYAPSSIAQSKPRDPSTRLLLNPEYNAKQPLWEYKPSIHRSQTDIDTPQRFSNDRPGIGVYGPSARAEGRSLSAGQSGIRRGNLSWLSFHASRSDLGYSDGWDDT